MKEYQMYTPSAEGYCLFRENYEKSDSKLIEKENDFFMDFKNKPENKDEEIVRARVEKLNSLYSTRNSSDETEKIINIILKPGFDEKLDGDGYDLIEELRQIPSRRTKKEYRDCLSFATKYCHHCRPDKYPIFDSVNVNVLTVCMGYQDSRNYTEYVECFKKFCSAIGCDELKDGEGFYIDKYIQAIGRDSDLLSLGVIEECKD